MPTTVAMFPGFGVEYPEMVVRFCKHHPASAAAVARWSAQTGLDLYAEPPAEPREQQRHRQLQVHVMNLLWWRLAGPAYPEASLVGHSFGFYAALVAAGVIDEDFSVQLVDTMFALSWDAWANNDRLVAVITAHRPLEPLELLQAHQLETLCINSDAQLVLYGLPPAFADLCDALGDDLIGCKTLSSTIPFHSWSMHGVTAALTRLMHRDDWHFRDPERALWCHVRVRPLADAAAAAEVLASQARLPVRWRDLIRALRLHGAASFVEIGPNRILSQTVRWIDPRATVAWTDKLRPKGERGAQ
jgi:acyl transferase domain-containing protein